MERGGNKVTCKDGEKRWDVSGEGEGEEGGVRERSGFLPPSHDGMTRGGRQRRERKL